ncbi:Uncharacterised protein [Moraxella lacunata]|uniref:DUF4304 domain-containing protein n=1 Tax=Moraxella lacunata TaxID=477 RepID=A0A378T9J1_MORLA|nr:hypothetical protein [Moraxella lacunata]STZ56206.1 Uncharacterised protein [Moraxella lacunata]
MSNDLTNLAFKQFTDEIYQFLHHFGFKKNGLNFYREQNYFRQIITIRKLNTTNHSITFTIYFGTDYCNDKRATFCQLTDFRHQEQISNNGQELIYEFNNDDLKKHTKNNSYFLNLKQQVLNDMQSLILPLFN